MIVDNTLANFKVLWTLESGDTGWRGVEHRNFLQLWFTHHDMKMGQNLFEWNEMAESSIQGSIKE